VADNSTLPATGEVYRSEDRAGVKTQAVLLDAGGTGAESMVGSTNPLPVSGGAPQASSGSLTAAAATPTGVVNTTSVVVLDVSKVGNITIGVSGTYSLTLTFEFCMDGTGATWFPLQGVRASDGTLEADSGAMVNLIRGWEFAAPGGATYIRVRCSTFVSGSASVIVGGAGLAYDPAPAVTTTQSPTATNTLTGVSASATSVSLLAANSRRKGATIANSDTSVDLFIRLGASAAAISSGSYKVMLRGGQYYELPFGWTGAVQGIWRAATGFANVDEQLAP
jgi:hypothetical protein